MHIFNDLTSLPLKKDRKPKNVNVVKEKLKIM